MSFASKAATLLRSPWALVPLGAILIPAVLAVLAIQFLAPRDIFDAALRGDFGRVQQFLREGESIDAQDESGSTPLHFATRGRLQFFGYMTFTQRLRAKFVLAISPNRHEELFHFLIVEGANLDLQDGKGRVPLLYADSKHTELLLRAGANPNIADASGQYPLTKSLLFRENTFQVPEKLRLLLEYGADPNVRDEQGNSVLHRSLPIHEPELKLLVEHGFDINAQNNNGDTLLHVVARGATWGGDAGALIQAGADPTIRNNKGETAADVAAQRGRYLFASPNLPQGTLTP